LAFEQFRVSLGLDIVHVPFTGAGPAVAAIVAGHTPIGISSLPPCVPQIIEGNLRALALTSKKRSQKLPDIPTVAEAGYPILEGDQWLGVFVPAATPKEIIATLHDRIVEIAALPDMKSRLEALDFYPVESTPEAFAGRIKIELETWRKVIRDANIRTE
jgi:tripartite-type tricarboxylate transporter receptor subunit TctC